MKVKDMPWEKTRKFAEGEITLEIESTNQLLRATECLNRNCYNMESDFEFDIIWIGILNLEIWNERFLLKIVIVDFLIWCLLSTYTDRTRWKITKDILTKIAKIS